MNPVSLDFLKELEGGTPRERRAHRALLALDAVIGDLDRALAREQTETEHYRQLAMRAYRVALQAMDRLNEEKKDREDARAPHHPV